MLLLRRGEERRGAGKLGRPQTPPSPSLSSPPKSTDTNNPPSRLSCAETQHQTDPRLTKGSWRWALRLWRADRVRWESHWVLAPSLPSQSALMLLPQPNYSTAPFYTSPAHSNQTSVIRYTPAPPTISPHQNPDPRSPRAFILHASLAPLVAPPTFSWLASISAWQLVIGL